MSMMNSAEAVRLVLDEAATHLEQVLLIYVEPDRDSKPLSFSRRITLPENDDMQLPFAVGCAQAGALPLLDLHALDNAAQRLEQAVRAWGEEALPPMVIRLRERACPDIAGLRMLRPANPRELAGALRYALQSGQPCLVVENPLGAYETGDVPDDWDELFDGASAGAEKADFGEAQEACDEAPLSETSIEDSFPVGAQTACEEEAMPLAPWGARSLTYDSAELVRTASLLGMARETLTRFCCRCVEERAELVIEAEAEVGERAFLPPRTKDACLWVGADALTLCWRTEAMTALEARVLLREAAARLELPVRLILDKEK